MTDKFMPGRLTVQPGEPIHQDVDGILKGQRMNLGINGGYFNRDILDLGIFKILEIGLQMMMGLGLPQDRFAQMVDVHPHALFFSFFQMGVEGRCFSGNDGPAAVVTHFIDHFGYGKFGKVTTESEKHLHQQFIDF